MTVQEDFAEVLANEEKSRDHLKSGGFSLEIGLVAYTMVGILYSFTKFII